MTGVGAVEAEAAHRVLESEGEQGALVEAGLPGTVADRPGGAGEQGEVGKADPARLERGHARRQLPGLLRGGDRPRRRVPGHGALVADPFDR